MKIFYIISIILSSFIISNQTAAITMPSIDLDTILEEDQNRDSNSNFHNSTMNGYHNNNNNNQFGRRGFGKKKYMFNR